MKKVLLAIALSALATSAYATVANSPHDLRLAPYNGARAACVYCHAAHKSATGTTAPLWNRTMSSQTFTQTNRFNITHTLSAVANGRSIACLSCHDGTVNLGSTLTNAETLASILAYAVIGGAGTLNTDHPVGVTYPTVATPGFVAHDTAATNMGFTAATFTTVECGTCHDPHLSVADGATKFLRVAAVTICDQCHQK